MKTEDYRLKTAFFHDIIFKKVLKKRLKDNFPDNIIQTLA